MKHTHDLDRRWLVDSHATLRIPDVQTLTFHTIRRIVWNVNVWTSESMFKTAPCLTFKTQMASVACAAFNDSIVRLILQVIAAEGEQKSARALKEASDIINESSCALQLRYLQTLNSISAEKNSTIIFPIPIEFLNHFCRNWNWQKWHYWGHENVPHAITGWC